MKLDNYYWVYQIKCKSSGKVYTGMTGQPNPCWRWSIHFTQLPRGKSLSPGLQAEWNRHSDWSYWEFITCGRYDGKRSANEAEAKFTFEVPESLRLNVLNKTGVGHLRRQRVIELLDQGMIYTEIIKHVDVSLGTVCNINKDRTKRHINT